MLKPEGRLGFLNYLCFARDGSCAGLVPAPPQFGQRGRNRVISKGIIDVCCRAAAAVVCVSSMLGHAVFAELRAAGAGLPLRTRRETQGRDRCQIVW